MELWNKALIIRILYTCPANNVFPAVGVGGALNRTGLDRNLQQTGATSSGSDLDPWAEWTKSQLAAGDEENRGQSVVPLGAPWPRLVIYRARDEWEESRRRLWMRRFNAALIGTCDLGQSLKLQQVDRLTPINGPERAAAAQPLTLHTHGEWFNLTTPSVLEGFGAAHRSFQKTRQECSVHPHTP